MDLNSLTLFQQMEHKMNWLAARQTVLSQNIANADTPGYKPSDLKPFSFDRHLELADALQMVSTNPTHLTGGNASTIPVVQKSTDITETSPEGNQVSLEDELSKSADTGMQYQLLTNLYRKHVGMMKTALGRGSSA